MSQTDNNRHADEWLAEYMGIDNPALAGTTSALLGADSGAAVIARLMHDHQSVAATIDALKLTETNLRCSTQAQHSTRGHQEASHAVRALVNWLESQLILKRDELIDDVFDPSVPHTKIANAGSADRNWDAENRLAYVTRLSGRSDHVVSRRAQKVLGIVDSVDLIAKAYTENRGDARLAHETLLTWYAEIAARVGPGRRGQPDEVEAVEDAIATHSQLIVADPDETVAKAFAADETGCPAIGYPTIAQAEQRLTAWLDKNGLNKNVSPDTRHVLLVEHAADLISEALYCRTSVKGALQQLNAWQHAVPQLLTARGIAADAADHRAVWEALRDARAGLRRLRDRGHAQEVERELVPPERHRALDAARVEQLLAHPLAEARRHMTIEVTDRYPESLYGRPALGMSVATSDAKMIFFARNLNDVDEAQSALRHEIIGHVTLREILGVNEYNTIIHQAAELRDNVLDPEDPQNQLIRDTIANHPHIDRHSEDFGRAVIAQATRNPGESISVLKQARVIMRRYLRRTGLAAKRPIDRREIDDLLDKAGKHKLEAEQVPQVRLSPKPASHILPTQRATIHDTLSRPLPASKTGHRPSIASEDLRQAQDALQQSVTRAPELAPRQQQIAAEFIDRAIKRDGHVSRDELTGWMTRPDSLISDDVRGALGRLAQADDNLYEAETALASAGPSCSTTATEYVERMADYQLAKFALKRLTRQRYHHNPDDLRRVVSYIEDARCTVGYFGLSGFRAWQTKAGIPRFGDVTAAVKALAGRGDKPRSAEFGQPNTVTDELGAQKRFQAARRARIEAQTDLRTTIERSPHYTDSQRTVILTRLDENREAGNPSIREADLAAWTEASMGSEVLPPKVMANLYAYQRSLKQHQAAEANTATHNCGHAGGPPHQPVSGRCRYQPAHTQSGGA